MSGTKSCGQEASALNWKFAKKGTCHPDRSLARFAPNAVEGPAFRSLNHEPRTSAV